MSAELSNRSGDDPRVQFVVEDMIATGGAFTGDGVLGWYKVELRGAVYGSSDSRVGGQYIRLVEGSGVVGSLPGSVCGVPCRLIETANWVIVWAV